MNRFIFLSAAKGFGGGEKYLELTCTELRKLGYEAYIYTGSNYIQCELRDFYIENLIFNKNDVLLFNGVGSVYRFIYKFYSFKNKIFIQHSLLNDGQYNFFKKYIRFIFLPLLLSRFSLVIRVCNASFPNFLFRNIETIYNGVPETKVRHVQSFNYSDYYKITIIGTLNDNKNQRLAIDIISYLPSFVHLYIIGDGENMKALLDYVEFLGLKDRVFFKGFLNDIQSEILNFNLLLLTSKFEACPYVVLEAMSAGIPVICNDTGGLSEIIKNGENGFLIENNLIESYLKCITILLSDKAYSSKIANNALKVFKDKFTIDKSIGNLLLALKNNKII
jgi:glycosyltransferase involved in cell wall biosynthesis